MDGRRLLASALHEVRTPIQTIISTIELLGDTPLNTEQSEYVRQIEFSANVLLNLANDVLDISKITSPEFKIETMPFDIISLTEHVTDLVSIEAFNKGIEIITSIDDSVPQTIIGDKSSIQRVLLNLLKNAVKFTEKGYVRTKLSIKHNHLMFEVIDSGIGVDEDKKDLVFNDYYQAESGTTRKYGGTGLGLAICRSLVTAMKGKIGVRDNDDINGGSVFWFSIPYEPAPLEESTNEFTKLDIPPNTRILIVDDNAIVLSSITHKLQALGVYDIETAQSGELALKKLSKAAHEGKPFTIAFIDMIMPGMDGWQLASEINNDPFISGVNLNLLIPEGQMRKDAQMKMLDWFNGYVYKPIKRMQLRETLAKALASKNIELEPLEAIHPKPLEAHIENPNIAQGSRILIAEDHPMNRMLLHTFLEKFGAEVYEAEDGAQAVSQIKKNPLIDVVFMDIQMPVKNGIDATIELRSLDYRGIIIACTANNSQEDFEQYQKMGVNDILVKPFKKSSVYQLLEKWQVVLSFPAIKSIVTIPEDSLSQKELWDTQDFMDTAGNDVKLAQTLIEEYLAQTQSLIDQITAALAKKQKDYDLLHRLAHTLKGSSATISAAQLSDSARIMNEAAKAQDAPEVKHSLTEFKSRFANFKRMVTKWEKSLLTME